MDRRRLLRTAAIAAAALFVTVAAATAGAVLWLGSEGGRAWLARTLADAAGGDGTEVRIAAIDGRPPFDLVARGIEVADADGTWLEIDAAALAIDPWPLLTGRLAVERVAAQGAWLFRMPAAGGATDDAAPFEIPTLPLREVIVADLAVSDVVVGDAIPGGPARLDVSGALTWAGQQATVRLDAARRDDIAGRLRLDADLDLDARLDPARSRADLALTYEEAEAGLLAGLLRLDGAPPVTLRLDGAGALDAWRGKMAARVGPTDIVALDLSSAGSGQGTRFAAAGTLRLRPGLTPLLAGLPRRDLDLTLEATAGRAGTLELDRLALAADDGSSLTLSGRIGGGTLALDGRLGVPSLAAWLPDDPGVDGRISADLAVAGTPDRPRAEATLAFDDAQGLPLGSARLAVHGEPAPDGGLVIDAEGSAEGLDHGLPGIDGDFRLTATGALDEAYATFDLAHLDVSLGPFAATAFGRLALDGGDSPLAATLRVADLAAVAPLAGVAATGRARLALDGTIDIATLTGRFAVDGTFDDLGLGTPLGDAALGRRVTLTGTLARIGDGRLLAEDMQLTGAHLGAAATITVDPATDGVDAAWRMRVPDIAPLADAVGVRATGRLVEQGRARIAPDAATAETAIDVADAVIEGREIGAVALRVASRDLLQAPRADIDLSAPAFAGGATAGLSLSENDNGLLELDAIDARAAGARLTGGLTLDPTAAVVAGDLAIRADDLAPLGAVAGVALGGRLSLDASLSARDGGQTLVLSGAGNSLAVADFTIRRLGIDAEVAGLSGAATGSLALDAEGAGGGALRFDSVQIAARAAAGDNGGTRITVDRLDATAGDRAIRLARPATLDLATGRLAVSDLDLAAFGGHVRGDLALGRHRVGGELAAEAIDLDTLAALVPSVPVSGTASARLSLGGTPQAPTADLAASWRDPSREAGLDATGRWRGGVLALRAETASVIETPLVADLSLPLVHDPDGAGLSVPADGALAGRVRGDGRLGDVEGLLPIGNNRVDGRMRVALDIAGTVAAPRVTGDLEIADARIENLTSGFLMTDGRVRLATADGHRLDVTVAGRDGGEGDISGRGVLEVDPRNGFPFRVELDLGRAAIARRDEVTAVASADLLAEGRVGDIDVGGTVTVHQADVFLPDRLPASVTVIEYTDVNCPSCPAPAADGDGGEAGRVDLDIAIDLPGRVFVRGRGLQSQWRGRLDVAGNAAAPRVTGGLEVVSGTIDLLGTAFTVSRGVIAFTGGQPVDPRLDIVAETEAGDVTGIVQLAGTATRPEISVTSRPPLPEDEVLSQVLFGTSSANLNSAQALQLANAVATLAGGGGPDVFERLRRTLGVSRLAVEESGDSGPALSVGTYVTDDLSVSLRQGLGGQSDVVVQYEVYPDIKLESEVGTEDRNRFGLSWEYDY